MDKFFIACELRERGETGGCWVSVTSCITVWRKAACYYC